MQFYIILKVNTNFGGFDICFGWTKPPKHPPITIYGLNNYKKLLILIFANSDTFNFL